MASAVYVFGMIGETDSWGEPTPETHDPTRKIDSYKVRMHILTCRLVAKLLATIIERACSGLS